MSYVTGLQCHLCKAKFPAKALWVCDKCLGPLEVVYDYAAIRRDISRQKIESRAPNLWRYRELLPIEGEPRTGLYSGYTPLVRADRLAARIGVRELYLKDDSVNHPTFSYKDRVVSVAATRAVELGFDVFGCASTGNLANSVAAHAARLALQCYVFIPYDLEASKILGSAIYSPQVVAIKGNYDDVNRLCTQIAEQYGWGFANINLRSYYAEGAKTYGFEIAEQLGWAFPRHVVSPVAGGTLLPRIARGFRELREVGLVNGDLPAIHAAQAAGCAPVINALDDGQEFPEPVKPNTIARSIAIGNPADGFQVLQAVRGSGGSGAMATDKEILEAVQLIAETEGIFTEPAGGTTMACAIKLIERGAIPRDESIVVCITGNGYKTAEVMNSHVKAPVQLGRGLAEFNAFMEGREPRETYAVGKK
jgi:threonine synthase